MLGIPSPEQNRPKLAGVPTSQRRNLAGLFQNKHSIELESALM